MKKSWIYYEMLLSSALNTEGNAAVCITPLFINAKRTAGGAGK
jgi:hypothetical protein